MRTIKEVNVVPVAIGAFGTITKYFKRWIEKTMVLQLIIETLLTRNSNNYSESFGHEMKIRDATIPKTTTGCGPLL